MVKRYKRWVIVGSESGHQRRPMEQQWAESIQRQCQAAGVAFFMKQLEVGGAVTGDVERFPEGLQVREFPEVCPAAEAAGGWDVNPETRKVHQP